MRNWFAKHKHIGKITIKEGMKVERLELEEVKDSGLLEYYSVVLLKKERLHALVEEELGLYATVEEAAYVADKFCDEHPEISERRVEIILYYFNEFKDKYEFIELYSI